MDELIAKVEALLTSINNDNNEHGGLLSRDTIRTADELRVVLSIWRSFNG